MDEARGEQELITIDQLAARVGMSVRNLREWRTLGLLPPAQMRGRTGFYSEEVVERIGEIQRLHREGFPLELIRRLLDAGGSMSGELMRLASALRAPYREERPPEVEAERWLEHWGTSDAGLLERAVELGLIRDRGDGQLEFTSGPAAAASEGLRDLGLSLEETLDAAAEIRGHADAIAELFERVWRTYVWEPFLARPDADSALGELREALVQMQPLATDSVLAMLTIALDARVEDGIAREVARAKIDSDR